MKKFAAFDLEISKELPENCDDWREHSPLGISCASMAFSDARDPLIWSGVPQMDLVGCKEMVNELEEISKEYTIVTWNGCKFDFAVLAEESKYLEKCKELATNHVDLMMIVTFTKGWYLGLDTALRGEGLEGKLKSVTLKDGTVIDNMSGAMVPSLWNAGEYDAVLAYLKEDVVPLVRLAEIVYKQNAIHWVSRSRRPQVCRMDKLYTVKECFGIPAPDTSWMDNPPERLDFVSWMDSDTLRD